MMFRVGDTIRLTMPNTNTKTAKIVGEQTTFRSNYFVIMITPKEDYDFISINDMHKYAKISLKHLFKQL